MIDLGMRTRLALALALVAAWMVLSGGYAVVRLRDAAQTLATVVDDRLRPLRRLQQVSQAQADALQALQQWRDGAESPDQAMARLNDLDPQAERDWAAYRATYPVPEETTLAAQAQPLLDRSRAVQQRVVALLQQGEREAASVLLGHELAPLQASLGPLLQQIERLQVRLADQELAASRAAYDRHVGNTLLGLAACWLLGALVAGGLVLRWATLHIGAWGGLGIEHRSSATEVQRQARFWAVLARTHQAIARARDERTLFDETARLCVDTGHTVLACVWRPDPLQDRLVAVGAAGPWERYFEGVSAASFAEWPHRDLPLHSSLREGRLVIVNDHLNDPRTAVWRERAREMGVRSVGAFPVMRGGVVQASLLIGAGEAGFFDPARVELLSELAHDLGLALDGLDREAARVAAEKALKDSEARLTGIVESAVDAIISLDAQRRIVLFNRTAARMLGVDEADAIGTSVDRFVPPEDRAQENAAHTRYLRTRETMLPRGTARRLTAMRANGERFPIELTSSSSGEGASLLVTVVFSDITEKVEAERTREARLAAEAASRAKTEFLSRMSHELRTPLNAVIGFSQLLQNDSAQPLTPKQQPQVEAIRQAGWHLLSLINDVLDISRIESGRLEVQSRAVPVAPLVDEVTALMLGQAQSCGVRLEALVAPDPSLQAWCDPLRLRQVLLNLVSNAVKYNRPGGSVRIACEPTPMGLCLSVVDTGLGMTPEQLKHLFEPFNRLGRERGGIEGTGIGMSLTRQLVNLMQGRLEVESTAGEGTTVRVTLPAVESTDDGLVTRPAGLQELPDMPGLPGLQGELAEAGGDHEDPHGTVLYVEDNDVNVIVVEQLLARWPRVQFAQAPDGTTGLELARRLQPDLVLLDMRLPDMDGPDVLRALQADDATRRLRVVALSASAMPDEVAAARACGAYDYWTKPLDYDRFLGAMRRLLKHD